MIYLPIFLPNLNVALDYIWITVLWLSALLWQWATVLLGKEEERHQLTAPWQLRPRKTHTPVSSRCGTGTGVCVCVSLNSNFSLNLLHYHELKWRRQKTQKLLVNVITNSLSCPYSVAFVSHYKSQTCVCSCSHDMTRVLFFILTLHQNRTRPCAALSPCE